MATIFSKLRTIVMSNVHDLLDKTIDLNSVGAVRQHVRDLENARNEISNEAAVSDASLNVQAANMNDLATKIDTTNSNIDLILGDDDATNDHLAAPLEVRLMGYEQERDSLKEEMEATRQTAQSLKEARSKVDTKLAEMRSALRRLESTVRTTKAKEKAADALTSAADLGNSAASVDSVTARIQKDAAIADSKFNQAMGSLSDSTDAGVVAAQAAERLKARRARLQQGK